jgi:glycosyltransferase involved in cell wall biosynthesis
MKISLIQPARNNLKYLKWSYDSIRKNQGDHTVEICVADDFSTDGTWTWCQQMMKLDPNFKAKRNDGPKRLGHTILYDKLINEVASHDLCMIFHADMYLCPGALDSINSLMFTHSTNGDAFYEDPIEKLIVSLTRIEPPLHPDGPEKVLRDFGIEPEEFNEEGLLKEISNIQEIGKTTEGIFAPWAFWKKDFQEIGGHDSLFAPQSKEDSDIFNRFQLNGVKFKQTWTGFVYHMTCRGSRFADGAKRNPDGQVFMKNRETDEWLEQNIRSTRNFIRKWGHFCAHDKYLKPVIPPKYNIGIDVVNCNNDILHALEPWCSTIYVDCDMHAYIRLEQQNTDFILSDRIRYSASHKDNDIIVSINGNRFDQKDFEYIRELSRILENQEQSIWDSINFAAEGGIHTIDKMGKFTLGNLDIKVYNLDKYEKGLIKCENK